MLNPWIGIGGVLALLGGALVAIHRYQRHHAPHPEVPRKLLHMTMGAATLPFPWLFDAAWPVVALAASSMTLLVGLRTVTRLRAGTGRVIHGVARSSLGDLCFPVAVCAVYLAADGAWLSYVIAMLLLTFADPAAAWAGLRYGRTRYYAPGGIKSVEGSLAFFVTSGTLTLLALLLAGLGPPTALLLALLVAGMMTLVESIAWHGLDNLFVPLGAAMLVESHAAVPAQALAGELIVLAVVLLAGAATVDLLTFRHRLTR